MKENEEEYNDFVQNLQSEHKEKMKELIDFNSLNPKLASDQTDMVEEMQHYLDEYKSTNHE